MRNFLHSLGVYFGLADETAEERAAREEIEMRQADMSLASLIGNSCLMGVIVGTVFGVFISIWDGALLSVEGAAGGGLFGLLMAVVYARDRLAAQRRAARH